MEYKKVVKKLIGGSIVEVDVTKIIAPGVPVRSSGPGTIQVRTSGEFAGKAYYLDNKCDWVLGKDNENHTILISVRR